MTDREHTIRAWASFKGIARKKATIDCESLLPLVDKTMELLKEQEAVEPYITGSGESFETAETWWYACGNCNEALDVNDKYCRHCGKPILWEGR